jgi:hypothetical protein
MAGRRHNNNKKGKRLHFLAKGTKNQMERAYKNL